MRTTLCISSCSMCSRHPFWPATKRRWDTSSRWGFLRFTAAKENSSVSGITVYSWSRVRFVCSHNRVVQGGFSCPRCDCQVCSIPSDCPVCQLTLISSSHLARSYHHLFPVAPFESVAPADCTVPVCFGCGVNLIGESAETLKFKCESCGHVFCVSCDAYIHASLHNCPGCLFKPCK